MVSSNQAEAVAKIINNHLAEPLSDNDVNCLLEEKGLDSIGFVEVIINLESEFGFSWPIEQLSAQDIKTANDFISVVASQLSKIEPDTCLCNNETIEKTYNI